MRRRLTYANVTATLALFFALSGGALAASHYLINSTRQINPKVLKALKGDAGATGVAGATGAAGVRGTDGSKGSEGPKGERGEKGSEGKEGLRGKEGKEGKEGAKGEKGESGAPGGEGKEGPPAKLSALTAHAGELVVKPGETGEAVAECPEGSRAITGGFDSTGEKTPNPKPGLEASEAQAQGKGWLIRITNTSTTESIFVEAIAYCAKEGEAIAG
jgi:hypothetical protein